MIKRVVDTSFVRGIQAVFISMTQLIEELRRDFPLNLDNPSRMSRIAATLHVLYYQVSIGEPRRPGAKLTPTV
jgi:hypothetical protein